MLQLTLCNCYKGHSSNKERDINHYQLEKEEGKGLSKKQKAKIFFHDMHFGM